MMSTYNGGKHVAEQIESIMRQQCDYYIRLIIRDDGSSDETCKIVKRCIEEWPERIELIEGDNEGYNASFFELIMKAGGYDYYSISDQDDVWLENKIQTACDMLEKEKPTIPLLYASTSYLVHDEMVPYGITRKKSKPLKLYNTIVQNICPGHSQVFNNELLKLLQRPIDTNLLYVYDSWITNTANLYGKILFDNTPHTLYRQYSGNQLGYGAGPLGRIRTSIKRNRSNDGYKYRKQIEYFIRFNEAKLKPSKEYHELLRFINAKKWHQRLLYSMSTKLYRQNIIETILLRFAILFGRF